MSCHCAKSASNVLTARNTFFVVSRRSRCYRFIFQIRKSHAKSRTGLDKLPFFALTAIEQCAQVIEGVPGVPSVSRNLTNIEYICLDFE